MDHDYRRQVPTTFKDVHEKYKFASKETNRYSELRAPTSDSTSDFVVVRARKSETLLKQLNEDKATGLDCLSARVLKKCARELGTPVAKLTRRILDSGEWPDGWRIHWVLPLYKKKSVWDPKNYRGVHLTAQLSKAVERLLGSLSLSFLQATGAFGENQFAYTTGRGCKDLLATEHSRVGVGSALGVQGRAVLL